MAKPRPSAEGAVLHSFRFSLRLTREELARRNKVTARQVGRWEKGEVPLDPRRLAVFLSPWKVPAAAVEAALWSQRLTHLGPADLPALALLPEDDVRLIDEAAAAGAWAAVQVARLELALAHLREQARAHRAWAEEVWSRLAKIPQEQEALLDVLRGDDRTWALAERICLASETAAADRASEALRLARLAVRLAEGCPGPEAWCLRVRGWCEPILANALRVGGDLPASAAQFASADELWRQGATGDPAGLLDGLRRLDLKASLFMYQEEHFEEAQALLDEALKGTSDDQARARLLIKKATALEITGDYEAALGVLDQAEPLIGEQSGSRNLFLHHFMKAVNLCHLDLFETGSVLVPVVEQLAADSGNELDQVRVRWLRGRTLVGLGRRAEALAALTEVRAYLHAERIAYDFALVSLEVAVAHLEQGQLPRVQELAEEMLWIFHDQGVHKEALAALTLFCQAAKAGEVEVAWTRRLIKYLYRAQYSPGLRFEP